MAISYEWDRDKAAENQDKHGITFDEAATVFRDLFSFSMPDPDHSAEDEERWVTLGRSAEQRLLVVVHVDLADDHLRLISARRATKNEAKTYAERLQ